MIIQNENDQTNHTWLSEQEEDDDDDDAIKQQNNNPH